MKRFFYFFLLSLGTYSCTEQKLTSSPESKSTEQSISTTGSTSTVQAIFNTSVGSPIDQATGLRWISNFTAVYKSAANNYYIQATTLKGILANSSCIGISLNYSLDPSGNLHIIPVGVDANGKVIATQIIMVDDIALNWQTAWQWINNYTGTVRSHFFGVETFTQLLENQKSKTVRLSRALNDSSDPQLLLSNYADLTPTSYQDESSPCPPYCPK